jgi:N-glycosylase/DNA lyase
MSPSAANSADPSRALGETWLRAEQYNLSATLDSGQCFRWRHNAGCWQGVIGHHWVRLRSDNEGIHAAVWPPTPDWSWLVHYLQLAVDLDRVLQSFPAGDLHLTAAVEACRGLRLLRQDPWECLASFILSSTKQIVQIRQIVDLLCQRFGEPLPHHPDVPSAWTFPSPQAIAARSEADLRACKMGFRAPALLAAARRVADGSLAFEPLSALPTADARARLVALPGVGEKIANCVLLFAFGVQDAFPMDVWVMKALRQFYFTGRRANHRELDAFVRSHFGPHAGYAQQYLFHYMRVHMQPQTRQNPPAL